MNKIALSILILATGCVVSCTKERVIPVDNLLRATFAYKPGTYWIYKDSATGREDSFAVLYNESPKLSSDQYNKKATESSRIFVYRNGILNDSLYCNWFLSENIVHYWYIEEGRAPMVYDVLFGYPYTAVDVQYGSVEQPCKIVSYQVADSFAGQLMANAVEIDVKGTMDSVGYTIPYNDRFFVTTTAGIVKMRFRHGFVNNVWDLQRYNMVR
jgi:hypothetical protein